MNKNHHRFSPAIFCFLFISVFIFRKEAQASHAMGADITYTCLGNNQYAFTFSFYRDCQGIDAPTTMDIEVTNSCGYPSQIVNLVPNGDTTEISPVCPTAQTTCHGGSYTGIQQYVYTGTITLPGPCADWTFGHAESARNAAITTITGAGSDNLYVYTTLNNTNGLCNNSPTFSNPPVPFACVGQRFCFNHGAFDVEGDSLAYQLITPLTDAVTPVTYLAGYSATQPVLSSPPMTFDAQSGDICMVPSQTDVTVLAVLVNEYRGGVLIGTVERDIQLTVNNCSNHLPSATGIDGAPSFSHTICANAPYCFFIASIDPDPLNTTTITWDGSIPGATFITTGAHRDTATFCWTPTTADISPNPYCFTVTVRDDNCPYIGTQIYAFCLTVEGVIADAGPDQTVACGTFTTLNGSATLGNGIFNYVWDPGGSSGPVRNNAGVGTYVLTVTSGSCADADTMQVLPGVGVPTADFTFSNNCNGSPINFTDGSSVNGSSIISWVWDFGDLASSFSQSPTHQYSVNGTYDVTLIVQTNGGCADTIVKQITINTDVPVAAFTAPDVCQGSAMAFTDQSAGMPTQWAWDFGDPGSTGNASNVQNPSHTFSNPGLYPVTLVVTNSAGCQNNIQQNINVIANPVVAVQGASICTGDAATLSAPNGFITYSWDNSTFTQAISVSPVVTTNYLLTVTDNNTCQGTTSVQVIVNPLPIVDAGINQTICEGTNATITATGAATYSWSPGAIAGSSITVGPSVTTDYIVTGTSADGCISSDQMTVTVNPMPVAEATGEGGICKGSSATLSVMNGSGSYVWTPGNYNTPSITVTPLATTTYTLTISDAIGCSGTDTVTVVVNPNPVAAFTNSGPVCVQSNITFTDQSNISSGFISGWAWDFGDGNSSSLQNPQNPYNNSGSINVRLIVSSAAGCRDTSTNAVIVNPNPVAYAGLDQGICPGFNANLSGSGGLAYLWTPGNFITSGITVSPATSTDYSLLVTDINGCQNSDVVNVAVNPVPIANAGPDNSICIGDAITLYASGGTDYLWSPGNVNTPDYNISPNASGTYIVTVTNQFGCVSTDQVDVSVNPLPVAAFTASGPVCEDNQVSFTDVSTVAAGSIASWNWDFGNNLSSTAADPSIPFNDPGVFNVTLVVATSSGCTAQTSLTQTIWATPVAVFNHDAVCEGLPITFTDNSTISDASPLQYQWDLGDNSAGNGTTFTHQYAQYGSYSAMLTVVSQNGCSSSFSSVVNVFALPAAAFNVASVCEDDAAAFNDQSVIPAGNISTWYWAFGDSAVSVQSNPRHTYADPGNYPIHLLITSEHGCQDSTDGAINIKPKPYIDFAAQDVCQGFPVSFTDLSLPVTGAITGYQWNFGDGNLDVLQNPVHTYQGSGWFAVSLTAVNDSGCSETLLRENAVHVYASPDLQFTTNATEATDIIPLVNFTNQTTSPGFYYWNFGDGDTSMQYSPTHIYPSVGTYEIQLVTIDLNGCVDTTYGSVEIRPVASVYIPNAFTPNGDSKNDVFKVYSWNVKTMEVQLYDRWGIKIYEWNNIDGGWDGKINGNPAQSDTYVYRVSTQDINNKNEIHIGHVSLVR